MSYVTVNAVTVPQERAEEFERRFGSRARLIDQVPGFLEFKLLKPADSREVWLVYTSWRARADFEAWVGSDAFRQAHSVERSGGPVGTNSELWAFEEIQHETAAGPSSAVEGDEQAQGSPRGDEPAPVRP